MALGSSTLDYFEGLGYTCVEWRWREMKFNKTLFNYYKCFISEDGEYKIVNYGGNVFLFHKIDCINSRGKKFRQFGMSVEHTKMGNSQTYKTYRDAFKVVNK